MLNAVAQQIVYPDVRECGTVPIAKKRFEYDGFATSADSPIGHVSDGFVTSSTVTRYDLDSHNSLGDIRLFDKTYNLDGTLKSSTEGLADDGATQTETIDLYDGFGLVVIRATSSAFDPVGGQLQDLVTSNSYDLVTLKMTSTTDANGTVSGVSYDGFGRQTLAKITPNRGGSEKRHYCYRRAMRALS